MQNIITFKEQKALELPQLGTLSGDFQPFEPVLGRAVIRSLQSESRNRSRTRALPAQKQAPSYLPGLIWYHLSSIG
jgi:hypothetical protein